MMKYRAEIDGLRAIAIGPVLLFHAGAPLASGGFIGVDIFFVISGFLITSIIFEDCRNQSFSISDFYRRRARRILPALVAVIVATAAIMPLFNSSPKVLEELGQSALSITLFASNIYFALTSGYFGTTSELSPLLHTWSLAVEEQFYVVFPLIMLWTLRRGFKTLTGMLLIITLVSLAIAEFGSRAFPMWNFYSPLSRAWELLIGSLGALAYIRFIAGADHLNFFSPQLRSWLSMCGLLAIAVSFFTFDAATPHPSLLTLLPVTGTLLILMFANATNVVGKLLSIGLMVHIGLISYSLYLWHQPILAIAKMELGLHLNYLTQFSLLLLSYIVSIASFRYIEAPFRKSSPRTESSVFRWSGFSLTGILVIGIAYNANARIQEQFFPYELRNYFILEEAHNAHENQKMYEGDCKFWSDAVNEDFESRFSECSDRYGSALLIIGGSHGMDLYNAIAFNTHHPFVASVSKAYCRAHSPIATESAERKCQYTDLETFVASNPEKIQEIIYTQTPDRLFFEPNLDIASEGDLSLQRVQEVAEYLARLKKHGVKVSMIGMLPPLRLSPIDLDYKNDLEPQLELSVSQNALHLTRFVDETFRKTLAEYDIEYHSKIKLFDLDLPRDLMIEGKITYSDARHISDAGEKAFGARMVSKLGL